MGSAAPPQTGDRRFSRRLNARSCGLLLCFSNYLSAHHRAFAGAGTVDFDHAFFRRRTHAAALDRSGGSGACLEHATIARNEELCAAKHPTRSILPWTRTGFETGATI